MTDSPPRPTHAARPERCRKDGWTPGRQLRFLDALAATRSITKAAAAAGMSRESAHRLRNRPDGALFAAIWDIALGPGRPAGDSSLLESHIFPLASGQLKRSLGNLLRRKSGEFARFGGGPADRF